MEKNGLAEVCKEKKNSNNIVLYFFFNPMIIMTYFIALCSFNLMHLDFKWQFSL